jgi:hypothetical protein
MCYRGHQLILKQTTSLHKSFSQSCYVSTRSSGLWHCVVMNMLSPKRRHPTISLCGVTTQKTPTWIFIAEPWRPQVSHNAWPWKGSKYHWKQRTRLTFGWRKVDVHDPDLAAVPCPQIYICSDHRVYSYATPTKLVKRTALSLFSAPPFSLKRSDQSWTRFTPFSPHSSLRLTTGEPRGRKQAEATGGSAVKQSVKSHVFKLL